MLLRFGTDGIRGIANSTLTSEFAVVLGRASAMTLEEEFPGKKEWLIGWDTRVSSEMLAGAFCAGVASAGTSIASLGVIPTAGVSFSCGRHGMPGAMITASHNPYIDNGIKIFDANGVKLRSGIERKIERKIVELMSAGGGKTSEENVGRIRWSGIGDICGEYEDWLTRRASEVDARVIRIGLDCANGAAHLVAPAVVKATGADVSPLIGCSPDGRNINHQCGSTHLDNLIEVVRARELDFGLALDGDADRLLAVDAQGDVVDGDEIVAILAHYKASRGMLEKNGVVVTEWSNQGLLKGLPRDGIEVEVCAVGDRAVAEAMERTGFMLGGEQSGHIIMKDLLPVGDGVSTAIELIAAVTDAGLPLRDVARRSMTKVPQKTKNVRIICSPEVVINELAQDQAAINSTLGDSGRLVLRASGTEQVVRIMAEAQDWERVWQVLDGMVDLLEPYVSR
jgi:phosphoglucosamine mutase